MASDKPRRRAGLPRHRAPLVCVMNQDPLAPVIAYHDQLRRLSAAGVALDLGLEKNGLPSSHRVILNTIQRVEDALKLRVELGQPLVEAVAAARELTPKYRDSLLSWIENADMALSFDPFTKSARAYAHVRQQLGIAFIHPMIILVLVWIAFVVLCSTMIPRLNDTYQQIWKQPPGLLAWLIALQHWMPVWLVLFPILLLGLGLFLFWQSRRNVGWWFSGTKRYHETLQLAQFADQLAIGLNDAHGQSETMSQADATVLASIAQSPKTAPLLNWALTGDLGNESKPKILRYVATCYRQLATERLGRWQSIFPVLLVLIIGGSSVFLVGFSLFMPLVDLLKQFTLPGGL